MRRACGVLGGHRTEQRRELEGAATAAAKGHRPRDPGDVAEDKVAVGRHAARVGRKNRRGRSLSRHAV